uniref:SANTA domain-containing protein n=1 Tax=Eptatretus burgeri TaxID=7764 RepID=A0A8C4R7A7_EPTBU
MLCLHSVVLLMARNDPPDQDWHTGIITRRLTARKLRTTSNAIYILDGPLNCSRAYTEGLFSCEMRRLFKNGFPAHWKKKTQEYLRIQKENYETQQLSAFESSPFTVLNDGKAFNSETCTSPSTHCVEPARQEARIGLIHSNGKSPSHDKSLNHVGWSQLCKEMEAKLPEQTFVVNSKKQSNMKCRIQSKFPQPQKSIQGVTSTRSKRSCKQTCSTTSKRNETPKSPVKLSEFLENKTFSVEKNTHEKPSLHEKDAIDNGLNVVPTLHCTTNDIHQKCKSYNPTFSAICMTTEPRHAMPASGLSQNLPQTDSESKQDGKDLFDPLHDMNCMTNDEQQELRKENDKYVNICSRSEESTEHVIMTRSRKKQEQQIDTPDHVDSIPSNGTDKMHVRNVKRQRTKVVDQKNDVDTELLKEMGRVRQLKNRPDFQDESISFTKSSIVNDSNSSKSHGNNKMTSVKNNVQRKVLSVGRSKRKQRFRSKCLRGALDEDDKQDHVDLHQETAKGDQDQMVPSTKKELNELNKAMQAVPTDELKSCEQVASLANGHTAKKCQQNFVCKPKSPKKKKPRLTKSSKKMACGGTEKAELVQKQTRVGTLKRKHEVREYPDRLPGEDLDDPFDAFATPISKAKKFVVSHLQQLKQKDKSDVLMLKSPFDKNSTTPDFQHHITPNCSYSPGTSNIPDRAVQAVPTDVPEYWEQVASLVNGRTAKECQQNFVCKAKSPKKKKPRLPKSTKKMTSRGTEKVKMVQITARAGTLKRKHEVREFLNSLHREDCDDPFDSSTTPVPKSKKFVVSHLQQLKQKDKSDVLMLKSPFEKNSTTPDFQHHITPNCSYISPGMLYVPDRKVTDHYVYRLENRKARSQWCNINSKLVSLKVFPSSFFLI